MTKYYEKSSMMIGRKIADEFILVPVTHNIGDLSMMYTLNSVGNRIWELLNGGGRTVKEIASILTQEFEVDIQRAEADVIEFLDQMEEIKAVVTRTEES